MTTVDREITMAPMPKHSEPGTLGDLLIRVGKALKNDGLKSETMVHLLAAQGWGTGTLGDGGARATDSTSSTERAATSEGGPLDRWHGADHRYHSLLRELERTGQRFESLHLDVLAHASDEDKIAAGRGGCRACERLCDPTKNPDNRLRGGLCPACHHAWCRVPSPRPLQIHWVQERRARLTDAHGMVHPEEDGEAMSHTSANHGDMP